ncbi:MAG: hypothetical protein KME20_24540 [Kaiparowitsia implicata GSE-PSE-MK54-09C]|nr:hypothetical protein [Kaiparowitsia implicata GSE-PSE-MK54-09C]
MVGIVPTLLITGESELPQPGTGHISEVAQSDVVDEATLRAAGVNSILRLEGGVLHLLVGLGADQYADEMNQRLTAV